MRHCRGAREHFDSHQKSKLPMVQTSGAKPESLIAIYKENMSGFLHSDVVPK